VLVVLFVKISNKIPNMNTLFIATGVGLSLGALLFFYARGAAKAIISKHRLVKIVLNDSYEKLSSDVAEVRKVAPRPSINMVKMFMQVILWPFYASTINFHYEASEEDIIKSLPSEICF